MGQVVTLYWRDIPAQVVAEKGRGRKREQAKIELHRRFALAIDEAAMRDGADSSDDYLADWRRGDAVECSDELEVEAAELLNVWKLNLTVDCLLNWSIPVAALGKALKVK